jgi:hypothetical protein
MKRTFYFYPLLLQGVFHGKIGIDGGGNLRSDAFSVKLNLNIALAFNNHIQYRSVIQKIMYCNMYSSGDPNVVKAMAEFTPRLHI